MFRKSNNMLIGVALVGWVVSGSCLAIDNEGRSISQTVEITTTKSVASEISWEERREAKCQLALALADTVTLEDYSEALRPGNSDHFVGLIKMLKKTPSELYDAGAIPPQKYKSVLGEKILKWFDVGITDSDDKIKKSTIVCHCVNSRHVSFPQTKPEKCEGKSLFAEYVIPLIERLPEYKPKMKNGVDRRIIDYWKKAADFAVTGSSGEKLSAVKLDLCENMYSWGVLRRPSQ